MAHETLSFIRGKDRGGTASDVNVLHVNRLLVYASGNQGHLRCHRPDVVIEGLPRTSHGREQRAERTLHVAKGNMHIKVDWSGQSGEFSVQ